MNFLKNHPFAVEAFFESSIVLTFAVPKEQLENLIPKCLELDIFDHTWAFIAVAMVQTRDLRPKGFPRFLGNDFFLIGYRIFVRYKNKAGKSLRGLYILKSETDKKKMEILGNLFTHYNYTTTDINHSTANGNRVIFSEKSNFRLTLDNTDSEYCLPENSPFNNLKEAARYAGPLPHTFTYEPHTNSVLIITGIRQHWKPVCVKVKSYHFEYLESLNLPKVILANTFEINNIPYYWEKGKIEKWS